MGFRVTPEMRELVGDAKIEALFAFARRIGCAVVGNGVTCTAKQKALITKWWKENKDDRQ